MGLVKSSPSPVDVTDRANGVLRHVSRTFLDRADLCQRDPVLAFVVQAHVLQTAYEGATASRRSDRELGVQEDKLRGAPHPFLLLLPALSVDRGQRRPSRGQ